MAAAALATVALGTAALLDVGPFAPAEPLGLEVTDRLEDCRDARRDHGEHCEVGADVEMVKLWLSDGSTLMVDLQLTDGPDLGAGSEWTAEFYIDIANAHTAGGVICGLSNVGPAAARDGEPGSAVASYALDPNTFPRQLLEPDACRGTLGDSSVRFSIDVSAQPDESPFRLIGVVRIEHPGDSDHPGSEDDFLVRASLADLRR